MNVSPTLRGRVLTWAANITDDPADSIAVAVNALPLLEWLQDAVDEDDLRARESALGKRHANLIAASTRGGDDPAEFIRSATVLYAFITGDSTPGGEWS
ncbi:hypothetical protein [Actinomadura violacea]|uniref:Uncharacterized protein n=1 Tax=Actinomadura violacea TaxID=2819934 RepID=A0ABS3RY95_9ACTN|nr:hypothetical protein [Actinomadura violacea]MBO2461616.1 hypothetical protein [Actinomadura violacea]